MQGIEIPIGAPLGQLDKDLKGASNKLKNFASDGNKNVNTFASNANSSFKSIALSLTGALSVGAFVGFGQQVLAVTAEFEKLGAVLGNTLGSNALAKLKLKEIEEFASKTPFGVKELTDSFVKLANQGFKPTGDEMRRLGDLAASTGKSFDQLAEGILDAQTGEFERLKEFGIKAQDAGDKVIFTFKGVQTTVDKSSEAIRNYVTSLGDAEGVSGSMAVISQTLTGKISNLGDSWDKMLVSIGSNTSGVFSSAIEIISGSIDAITEFNRELETASKFKIKGNLFESIVKYAKIATNSAGANAGFATTQDLLVQSIQRTEKSVNDLVSGSVSAAKSTDDFGKSIIKLKTDGDNLIKSTANLDLKSAYKKIYEDAIKALKDGREAFGKEASKTTTTGGLNLDKKEKAKAEKLKKEADESAAKLKTDAGVFGQQMITSLVNFRATVSAEADKKKAGIDIIDQDALDTAVAQSEVAAKAIVDKFAAIKAPLLTPFQGLSLYIKDSIIPQLSSSFKTFFDDLLMNGKLSFDTLGQAIKNTFLSVLSSEATKGVLSLLSSGGKNESGEKGKGGGLIGIVGSLLKIGKGGAAAGSLSGVAASTGGVILGAPIAAAGTVGLGTAGAAAGATAATGGALLPILAGVAAIAGIASLFKKKPQAPIPQASSTISTSAAGSSQDFGGGRVVFEISGTNLIGVLNRAGAKLQRFGP
jgi:hypothetical protein